MTQDDRLALAPLHAQGVEVVPFVWNPFDACRGGLAGPVFNPVATIQQWLSKRYLLRLQQQGVAIPTTLVVERGATVTGTALQRQLESGDRRTRRESRTPRRRDRRIILVELEVIDPMLFFARAPGAAARFAHELVARVRTTQPSASTCAPVNRR